MVSANQEKYLWQIYSNMNEDGYVQVSRLAYALQVSRPSASKIAKRISEIWKYHINSYNKVDVTLETEE